MQLLLLILKDAEFVDTLIQELAACGVKGGTLLEGKGMADALVNNEDYPVFGILRHMMAGEEKESSYVLMFVLRDEQVMNTRNTVKSVLGDLKDPNSGIMFSIPLTYVEGLGD
ncbi:MAG: hypothetical protein GX829_06325 [Clostridium sp.]|nr:hypothetical protein [Clostridium sp.]